MTFFKPKIYRQNLYFRHVFIDKIYIDVVTCYVSVCYSFKSSDKKVHISLKIICLYLQMFILRCIFNYIKIQTKTLFDIRNTNPNKTVRMFEGLRYKTSLRFKRVTLMLSGVQTRQKAIKTKTMKAITTNVKQSHERNKKLNSIQAQLLELNKKIEVLNEKLK